MKKYSTTADIRAGVVGYGGAFNMGREHLSEMQAAGMTPVAVAEIDPARLAAAGKDFPGIGLFPSVRVMLRHSDVNLVAIITPHNTHAALALQCLRAGRHVVCEKPLAITTAEVDAMIRTAKQNNVLLSTYHNRHWDGSILQAVDLVKKQRAIGEVFRITCHMGGYGQPGDWWRSSRSISGGILYDWGVHFLEYALQLIEEPLSEVCGFAHTGFWAPKTKWKKDTIEDEGFLVVRFEGGKWLTLTITQLDSRPREGVVEITGCQGTLVFDGKHSTLFRHEDGVLHITKMPHPPNQWQCYYANVAAFLTGREDLVITPEWARRPIHILDLAVRSAKQGRALKVKYR